MEHFFSLGAVYAPAIKAHCSAMELPSAILLALGGLAAGWWIRSVSEVKDIPAPCACHCSCVHQSDVAGSGSWAPSFWVSALICVLVTLLVGVGSVAALAFKISFTQKEGQQELAISVKGKSKGILNPQRALQITN